MPAKRLTSLISVANSLKNDAVGIFPCDTVWGLVGRITDDNIRRIAQIKRRDLDKGLVIVMPHMRMMADYVDIEDPILDDFLENLWPGDTTVVLPKKEHITPLLSGGKGSLAVRIPFFDPLTDLLYRVGEPLIATSANRSGMPTPAAIDEVDLTLFDDVDFFYDLSECGGHKASQIIDCTGAVPEIIRE